MPELPEVELTARNLQRWMSSSTIVSATVPNTRIVRGGTPSAIVRALVERRVKKVDRRGKWLRFVLDDDTRAFSHLGMSGRWLKCDADDDALRSERVRLDVERSSGKRRVISVRYTDPRMFGRFVVSHDDIADWTNLGPDPLVDGIDGPVLATAVANVKRTIKETLMDQTRLAGVGNIQATEALWRAKIDPRRVASSLERRELSALARAIRWSIDRTLDAEKGPEIEYVEDAGSENPFLVYARGGEPCPRCKTALKRYVLGGRGTVSCPRCQT